MTGVPRSIAEHRLNIREGYLPVRQKKRGQAPERAKAIQTEVQKLVEAGIMRKVYYHDYLSNPVMVKKHDGSWRISGRDVPGEVQSLNGKLAGLNRFLSKSAEKSLPLFKTLKKCIKKSDFYWTPEAEQAFKKLKQHISKLPMLVAPKLKEELIMYLFASYGVISEVRRWPDTNKPRGNRVYLRVKIGVCHVQVSVDSKLVENQVLGTYDAKEENMIKYLERVKTLALVLEAMAKPLTPITTPWPFYKWGIDIAGPFLEGPGKAVIPAEIGMPTYRTAVMDAVHNNEELRLNLDLLEERRDGAAIREAKAKLNMKKYYNAKVRGVTFRPGDFVYRSNDASHTIDGGKLGPKW
ncbi:hypothetical protein Tco_1019462 [Tanacetum coccineum]|uniref:Reverse transcriptase domain-containing protein n=1 Tax=Tanacetum coccineum TaxID=301880 RepID=A0ABQ5FXA4_9ASTR